MSVLSSGRRLYRVTPADLHGKGASRPWLRAWVLGMVLVGSPILAIWPTWTINNKNRVTEEEIAANFYANEARFAELIDMLTFDDSRLDQSAGSLDLSALLRELPDERAKAYGRILGQIAVADMRYFSRSGKLILLPSGGPRDTNGAATWYLYLPSGQPEPIAEYHGYSWRGPGMYFLTGDRPLASRWFIHHNAMVEVAFAPY